jgi:hypothetical protein
MVVIIGDARLRLQDAEMSSYQVILLEAFSSDAIPAPSDQGVPASLPGQTERLGDSVVSHIEQVSQPRAHSQKAGG